MIVNKAKLNQLEFRPIKLKDSQLPETLKVGEKYWVPCIKMPVELREVFLQDAWMPVFATPHIDAIIAWQSNGDDTALKETISKCVEFSLVEILRLAGEG